MSFDKKNRSGIGAGGAMILLVLLLVIGFLGASTGMPFVARQTVTVGDYMTYEENLVIGNTSTTETFTFTITGIDTTQVSIHEVGSEGTDDNDTYDYSFEGQKMDIDMPFFFMNSSDLDDCSQSYWVTMVGYVPMLVEKYTFSENGTTATVLVKPGTNMVVFLELTTSIGSFSVTLKDTSFGWMTLL